MFSADILQPSTSLELCSFINNIQKWCAINIHNINHN
jgi:hypothetical protein